MAEVELLGSAFVFVTAYCVCISVFLAHDISVLFTFMKFSIEKVGRLTC
jgi:hypothetical protein